MEHHKSWGMEGVGPEFFQTLCKTKFKAIISIILLDCPKVYLFLLNYFFKKVTKTDKLFSYDNFEDFFPQFSNLVLDQLSYKPGISTTPIQGM